MSDTFLKLNTPYNTSFMPAESCGGERIFHQSWSNQFGTIPVSSIYVYALDFNKTLDYAQKTLRLKFEHVDRFPNRDNKIRKTLVFSNDKEDTLFRIEEIHTSNSSICALKILAQSQETAYQFLDIFKQEDFQVESKGKSKFDVVIQDGMSYRTHTLELDSPNLDVGLNYGTDFVEKYNTLIQKLEKPGGLFLLSGEIGTGKTTLLKHLASKINRNFIFVPPGFIESLVEPTLLSVMIQNPRSILIIEDAEKCLLPRSHDSSSQSVVSTILNLTDGIMGSLLETTLIVTSNAEKRFMDSALLRKGRLQFQHHFCKLSCQDAQKLIKHLNKEHTTTEQMSLAEIYNLGDYNYHIENSQKTVGFAK